MDGMTGADWFVPLSEPADAPAAPVRVHAIPHAGGGCAAFTPIADRLAPGIVVRAANLPARQARFLEPPCTDLDALLDALADAYEPGPGVVLGYCSGALIAFLLVRRLRRRGLPPPGALVVASYPAPDAARPARTLHTLPSARFWAEILSYGGVPSQVAARPDFREIFEVGLRADYELLSGYEYAEEPALDVPIVAVRGAADPLLGADGLAGWARHTTASCTVVDAPGDHWLIDTAPDALAELLREAVPA
ncbi:thioesterase [Dactylosporangium roseum]|uniref:Thioesterase n=1 Tax=Dactylosporangium roseum TaxID=47989 RepID=A0ABY5ZF90_9ACTN|nr:thioesterase domain-containing protein [Dactylosporangium roseum]UWZ39417.1 thioesterase [Dactylosporangium roseum]